MPRLYRPHIPLSVKCAVAERQVFALNLWMNNFGVPMSIEQYHQSGYIKLANFRHRLEDILGLLAGHFRCQVSDLRLDHNPPLGARVRSGEGKGTVYDPDANDPAHLLYRPHGPEFEGSHLIKTNVRGEHGQHPDRVLIKKHKRLEMGPRPKRPSGLSKKPGAPKQKWPSRPFDSKRKFQK